MVLSPPLVGAVGAEEAGRLAALVLPVPTQVRFVLVEFAACPALVAAYKQKMDILRREPK